MQLFFLMLVYGFILLKASKMIADGSEMLMLIINPGVIGGLVLPVMGALPDGAMVLFSGLGDNAQESLTIGVGTLAGSTVSLLTWPWMLCTFSGAVNLIRGENHTYNRKEKLTNSLLDFKNVGTVPTDEVKSNAKLMLATCLLYLVIQAPSFYYIGADKADTLAAQAKDERNWALAGLILSLISFIAYCTFQIYSSVSLEQQQAKITALRLQAVKKHYVSLAFLHDTGAPGSKEMRSALTETFKKYDENGDGFIDASEISVLFANYGITLSKGDIKTLIKEMDAMSVPHGGVSDMKLTLDEFVKAMETWLRDHPPVHTHQSLLRLPGLSFRQSSRKIDKNEHFIEMKNLDSRASRTASDVTLQMTDVPASLSQ